MAGRSTVHYADNTTNNILKQLHNKLRPAGTPVERVEYIIELLLLRIFEIKLQQDKNYSPLRSLFNNDNEKFLFSYLTKLNTSEQIIFALNRQGNNQKSDDIGIFQFYSNIIAKAKLYYKNDIPIKVLDQLTLMEEIYSNSTFTNNVNGGVIPEIISLIKDIDHNRILETDLLGDAIESALSETGGTKDIGLFRTPNHIRQLMVMMADPDYSDTIYDPTCGTGGFLFDAFGYVIEKTAKKGKWPGDKSHKEIKEYINQYIYKLSKTSLPTESKAMKFYRGGISGIEYLGRIRKMSAINMYIRGLNPHNILQGDSLKLFDPQNDAGTKTVILANPPFGAERDQPSYPNIWEEYSKESETTILFVKLMYELLNKNGRCAVVVSEGFLSWPQNSAVALRKLLLKETNLKAIISLPQGVFVSKGGQGAKTSILYFEKGNSTNYIWYYKIENDGYTMGTNRKEIEGCQIPEILEIWQKIKNEEIPIAKNNSFCIPKSWIETTDPRIIERIKNEIRDNFIEKNKYKKEKYIKDLTKKLQSKALNRAQYEEKIKMFGELLDSQIENEIIKNVEKANTYHYNLQNYKSNLTIELIKEWKQIFKGIKPKNYENFTKTFQELQKANPDEALKIIAGFDPENALHVDIIKEYLGKIFKGQDYLIDKNKLNEIKIVTYKIQAFKSKSDENKNLRSDNILQKLDDLLKKGLKYPQVTLNKYLIINDERIKPSDYKETEFIVLGVSNQIGVFINEKLKGFEIKQSYFKVYKNQFCYNPYRINVGSIGLNEYDNENQIISGAYNIFGCKEKELNPKYLYSLLKTQNFLDYVNDKANGGVRMDFKIDYLLDWQIPLPSIDIQNEIVRMIEKQKKIINGAEEIINNWGIENNYFDNYKKEKLSNHVDINLLTINPVDYYKEKEFIYIDIESVENGTGKINYNNKIRGIDAPSRARRKANDNEIIISTVRPYLKAFAFISNQPKDCIYSTGFAILSIKNKNIILGKYLFYQFLGSNYLMKQMTDKMEKGSYPSINQDNIENFNIAIPPIEIQQQIVVKLDHQMQALEDVRLLKQEAEKKIEEIINAVWGE